MTLIFFWGGRGGEEVRWKTVRTYGKILATPLVSRFIAESGLIFLFKALDLLGENNVLEAQEQF